MTPSFPHGVARHGGRLREAATVFSHAPRPWLDLSTGISPYPWRGDCAPEPSLGHLPDPADLLELEEAAADAFAVSSARQVIATAGADQALRYLPAILRVEEVAIVSPTYGGHAEAWRGLGAKVIEITSDSFHHCTSPVLVIVNPNNPDGRVLPRETILEVASRRSRLGLWTVVDESFVETIPGLSVADGAIEHLIVLRSFGKFYGLPGVRLGFAVMDPAHAPRVLAIRGDWPVTAHAITIGRAAYRDRAWREEALDRLKRVAARLDDLLHEKGLGPIGEVALFRLVETSRASEIFQGLCARGVLIRPFADASKHLRIGLADEAGFDRLTQALDEVMA